MMLEPPSKIPLAQYNVGYPATAAERLLSVEFRLWFSSRGPMPLAKIDDGHLAQIERMLAPWVDREVRNVARHSNPTEAWGVAAFHAAWLQIIRAERLARERGKEH